MIVDGRKVVAAAGTREKLSTASVGFERLIITAETDNTGVVVIGASTVVAAVLTRRGHPLAAGASVTLDASEDATGDMSAIWLDAMVSGDGVTFLYTTNASA